MPKTDVEKFNFSELKFTQSLTKFYCISIFNVGGCLASCLTFRPFLTSLTLNSFVAYKKKKHVISQY